MTHEQVLDRLDDFAGGELPDTDRLRVQRHLDECGECRAEADALRALLDEARFLPREVAPPRDLWAGIASRLEPKASVDVEPAAEQAPGQAAVISLDAHRARRMAAPRWMLQAAAAVVLVAGSSAVTRMVMQRESEPSRLPAVAAATPQQRTATPPVTADPNGATLASNPTPARTPAAAQPQTALAAFRPAQRDYQRAIGELVAAYETRRSQLSPETAATLERNLRIIDQAIGESTAALEKDPNSRQLTEMLGAVYDTKVKMLQQAVQL